jgi:hypothetical protein
MSRCNLTDGIEAGLVWLSLLSRLRSVVHSTRIYKRIGYLGWTPITYLRLYRLFMIPLMIYLPGYLLLF